MDVSKRDVVHAAGSELVLAYGVVGRVLDAHIAVDAQNVQQTVLMLGVEAAQHCTAALIGKRRAEHARAELRQRDCFNVPGGEHVYVFREIEARVGGFRRIEIMVAGRNEYRRRDLAQRSAELLASFVVCIFTVEQVAREQHKLHALSVRKLGYPRQQRALFAAAYGGLACREPLKRGVQMQVGSMENFYLAHVNLIPSALRHLPVSGSISNMQPSSFAGPFAAS